MGTGSLPRGVKRTGRGVDHAPPSSAKVKERVDLYLYYAAGPSWPLIGRTLSSLYGNIMARQKFNGRDEVLSETKENVLLPLTIIIIIIMLLLIILLKSYPHARHEGVWGVELDGV
jgi:hypothetical protein